MHSAAPTARRPPSLREQSSSFEMRPHVKRRRLPLRCASSQKWGRADSAAIKVPRSLCTPIAHDKQGGAIDARPRRQDERPARGECALGVNGRPGLE